MILSAATSIKSNTKQPISSRLKRFIAPLVLLPSLTMAVALPLAVVAVYPAQAQGLFWGHSDRDELELFVDSRGRRFLVDVDTGEVVGRANRHARFTRRDKIRAQREYRRNARYARDQFEEHDDYRPRRRRYTDILTGRRSDRRADRRLQPGETRRDKQPDRTNEINKDNDRRQLASLPLQQQSVERAVRHGGMAKPKYSATQIAQLQVVLDREGFSPGVIDGRWGSNVARAAVSWKQAKKSKVDLGNPEDLKQLIKRSGGEVFTRYTIRSADVTGPFVAKIPVDYAEKARLKAMSYTSVEELLAERFHMSQAFLQQLNPDADFNRPGTAITVIAPGNSVRSKVHYLVADKSRKQVRAFDRNGDLVSSYPATIGSAATPSPSGTHTIERVAHNPDYTYNPKKNFQQGNNDRILRIAPGPNGPVGSVWIALSKPSYGIHGTPNPRTIGKTNSHGCIRLTNWDAQELAKLVRPGVTVQFVE